MDLRFSVKNRLKFEINFNETMSIDMLLDEEMSAVLLLIDGTN